MRYGSLPGAGVAELVVMCYAVHAAPVHVFVDRNYYMEKPPTFSHTEDCLAFVRVAMGMVQETYRMPDTLEVEIVTSNLSTLDKEHAADLVS